MLFYVEVLLQSKVIGFKDFFFSTNFLILVESIDIFDQGVDDMGQSEISSIQSFATDIDSTLGTFFFST